MPDIPTLTTLTAQIVGLLALAAPFLSSIPTGAAEHLGAEGVELGRRLFARLRQRISGNAEAEQTLALFANNPANFQSALAGVLAPLLQQHPEWAQELAALLAEPNSQRITARNKSVVEDIQMSMSGAGQGEQAIEADNSKVKNVRITQK